MIDPKSLEYPPISQARREKMLKILNGYNPLNEKVGDMICQAMHYLDCHFPPQKLDAALDWLLKNQIVGRKFAEWFFTDCRNSHLTMMKQLTMRIEHENSMRPLFFGADVH